MSFVMVYKFKDAPEVLRALSTNGGDEDWVAVIPEELAGEYFGWMEEGSAFGYCCVDEYDHLYREGFKIRIGSHA